MQLKKGGVGRSQEKPLFRSYARAVGDSRLDTWLHDSLGACEESPRKANFVGHFLPVLFSSNRESDKIASDRGALGNTPFSFSVVCFCVWAGAAG